MSVTGSTYNNTKSDYSGMDCYLMESCLSDISLNAEDLQMSLKSSLLKAERFLYPI